MAEPQQIAVVLLSGGLDSMVAAGIARERGFALHALTVDYGQRHRREIASATQIARALGAARHVVLPLDLRQFGGSALTDDIAVPKEGVGDTIPVTYVPARNLVFLALTAAFAESAGARDIFIGVNALDYSGYPDCRPEFIASFAETARLGTKAGIEGRALRDPCAAAAYEQGRHRPRGGAAGPRSRLELVVLRPHCRWAGMRRMR